MNRLREEIKKRDAVRASVFRNVSIEEEEAALKRFRDYIEVRLDAICDLIDAAYTHDCSHNRVCPICAALAKLEGE
jgi:hypothetical protein